MFMVFLSCSDKKNIANHSRIKEIPGMIIEDNQSLTAQDLKKSDESIKDGKSELVSEAYLRRLEEEKKALKPEDNKSGFTDLVSKKTEQLLSEENASGKTKTIFKDISLLRKFSVITGSFADSVNSIKQVEQLKGLNYEPFCIKNSNGMFRVFAGTFDEKIDAEIIVFRLENDSIKSWIMIR